MRSKSVTTALLLALSLMLISASATEAYDIPGKLYRVSIESYRGAEALRDSGVDIILGGYNEYLVMGEVNTIDRLQHDGVRCELLNDHFDPSEWVIAATENRNVDLKSESLSLSSGDRILFGDQVLVKRDVGKTLQQPANGVMLLDLPVYEIPVRYQVEQPRTVTLHDLDLIDSLVNLVSRDSVEAYDRRLEAFVSRHSDSDSIMAARDWIAEKFASYGLDVTLDPFHPTWGNPTFDPLYNVVGDHVGTTAPETYIVVGAHYDATSSGDPRLLAPGADDNGSGTAMCIEFARILSNFDMPKSFRIICFAGEEQGLVGSTAYVHNHPGLNIEIMINADMIANNSGSNTIMRVLHNTPTRPYAYLFDENMDAYTTLNADIDVGNSGRSDHAPFEQAGYHAVFLQEGIFSPNYHSPRDIADNLDFDYMAEVVKGAIATAYQIAFAPPAVPSMTVTDAGTGDELIVAWPPLDDSRDFQFKIKVGTTPGIYSNFYYAPKSDTSYILDGLTEGTEYYIAVGTAIGDTSESIVSPTGAATPHSIPFPPTDVAATAAFKAIKLSWVKSIHPDVIDYAIFRSIAGADNFDTAAIVGGDEWLDTSVDQENYYDYYIEAMDADSNYSTPTDTVKSRGLFFNRNALIVVEITPDLVDTAISLQRYRYFFADIRHDLMTTLAGAPETALSVEELGQYKSVFWFSDFYTGVGYQNDDLQQYRDWGGNLFFCGWTIVTPLRQMDENWFGLNDYTTSAIYDFRYGEGENGWPDAILDSTVSTRYNSYGAYDNIFLVTNLDYDPEISSPAYQYVSSDPESEMNGRVCGVYAE